MTENEFAPKHATQLTLTHTRTVDEISENLCHTKANLIVIMIIWCRLPMLLKMLLPRHLLVRLDDK